MNTKIDISNIRLETKRLCLRAWRQQDVDDLYAYASVDGVGQMAGWRPHENKEETQQILHMFIEEKKTFAIVLDGKVIGSIGIEEYDETQCKEFNDLECRELGFVLSKAYWGCGIMKEAVDEVLRYLFEEVQLDAVFCGHYTHNYQSARVQEKCGFKRYRPSVFHTRMNTTEEGYINVLTKQDWLQMK